MDPATRQRRRTRLIAVVAASALLAAALMNLFLVVEGTPEVDPEVREGRTWHAQPDAPEWDGVYTWTFVVDGNDRKQIDLAVEMPYTTRVTHVAGTASLVHRAEMLVDGETIGTSERTVEVGPEGNATERVSRTKVVTGDLGETVRVERDDRSAPFSLVVVWSWEATFSEDAEVVFRTEAHPLHVEAPDTGGLPGCDRDCALALALIAGVGQAAAMVWHRRSDTTGKDGHG